MELTHNTFFFYNRRKGLILVIIYKITNKINRKNYIGQTCRTLEERMKEHLSHTTQYIDKVLRKYGKDNFEISIIDNAITIDELNEKEMYWISHFDSIKPNGYNLCIGGDNTKGYSHRLESRLKMSESQYKRNMKGENNPFYGKEHSDETKKKMKKSWEKRQNADELKRQLIENAAKKNRRKVINIDTKEVFDSVRDAAEKYNLKETHISRVCRGGRKRTGGFEWMYYDEYKEIPCQAQIEKV